MHQEDKEKSKRQRDMGEKRQKTDPVHFIQKE